MMGLIRPPPGAGKDATRGNSSARNRTIEKSALASTTDLKASVNAGQPAHVTNADGRQVPLNQPIKSQVTFDADFESANLDQVRVKGGTTFDCFMRNDTNATGNLQWFYFRMKNTSEFMDTVRINIVNFTKGNSLFHHVSSTTARSLRKDLTEPGPLVLLGNHLTNLTGLSLGNETIDLVDKDESESGGGGRRLDLGLLRERDL